MVACSRAQDSSSRQQDGGRLSETCATHGWLHGHAQQQQQQLSTVPARADIPSPHTCFVGHALRQLELNVAREPAAVGGLQLLGVCDGQLAEREQAAGSLQPQEDAIDAQGAGVSSSAAITTRGAEQQARPAHAHSRVLATAVGIRHGCNLCACVWEGAEGGK